MADPESDTVTASWLCLEIWVRSSASMMTLHKHLAV